MKTTLRKTLLIIGTCLFAGSVVAHGWRYERDLFIKNQTDVPVALGDCIIFPGMAIHVPMRNHVETIRLKTVGPQGRWFCLVQPGNAPTETITVLGLGEGLGCSASEGVAMDTAMSP